MTNTRTKDFCDLLILARRFPFDGSTLATAVQATFARRTTDLPPPYQPPIALSDEFTDDAAKQAKWQGFLRRSKLGSDGLALRGHRGVARIPALADGNTYVRSPVRSAVGAWRSLASD